MAPSLWNDKKKLILFLEPMLLFHPAKSACNSSLATNTPRSILQQGQWLGGGSGFNICGDLRTLCMHGRLKEALVVLHFMDNRDVLQDDSAYASLLQGCGKLNALLEGKLVHAHIIQTGFSPNTSLGNKLLSMYAKCGSLVDARQAFEEMPQRNVVSWTAMIATYARHGRAQEALTLFYEMQRAGIQPDEFAFASVLPACANMAALEHGKKLHEDIIRSGFQSNVFVASALVDTYAKCGSIDDARIVFDKMPERNMVSWTAIIGGYAQNGHVHEALELFEEMPRRDAVSWNVMIAGYAQNGHVHEALKLFEKMPERNLVSWNAIIAGCAQHGYVDEALKLFHQMPKQDVVSWTAMIAGYAQNGHFDEALKLFRQMQLKVVKPNSVTFAAVLPACANLAVLQQGKEVHAYIIRNEIQSYVSVGNALVDMYAKCGSIVYARKMFDKIPERNVVSWTAMIAGYAMHGYGVEALQLFEKMEHSGVKPDGVTFIGVLSACCHAGLVDDGWQYFKRMNRDYHITPAAKHYCCMVDLLGRAGHLDEAQAFINKMPVKPNSAVWGSLLAACRTHTNIELGEYVAERLFQLEPENTAHYVLLSNIYAAAGRWDDKEKVRKIMKDRKLKMRPGLSWIEVDNKVHTFLVGDRSHPQTEKIYAQLDRLSQQMKAAGYVPVTNFVLRDVEEEEKEHILCHHSEKLAIAFGLINTSPGTPIRIIKNLRVCGDCHSATKFIAKIAAREIVVRDASRFHHFKDGQCSCGDYW
eukprot:Gb_15508 [translate_table: standard]